MPLDEDAEIERRARQKCRNAGFDPDMPGSAYESCRELAALHLREFALVYPIWNSFRSVAIFELWREKNAAR